MTIARASDAWHLSRAGIPTSRSHISYCYCGAVDPEFEPYPANDGLAQEMTPSERNL